MNALVHSEGFSVAETPPAVRAVIGPFSAVDSLMSFKVHSLIEALPTDRTQKGSVSGMDSVMVCESSRLLERFPAHSADVLFVGFVGIPLPETTVTFQRDLKALVCSRAVSCPLSRGVCIVLQVCSL